MNLRSVIGRAKRGFREDAKLHVIAISSLTVAFLCLLASLVVLSNTSNVARAWGRGGRMTVFLRDGAPREDVEQIRGILSSLTDVAAVDHVTAVAARERFVRDTDLGTAVNAFPVDAFPASLEVTLRPGISRERSGEIASRLAQIGAVEDVETYRSLYERIETLLRAAQSGAGLLAFLVAFSVLAIVGNTIRLAVAGRREEIEVLKLCGATDPFVRGPFLVEGAVQGAVGAAIAVVGASVAYILVRPYVEGTFHALTGVAPLFLHPAIAFSIVLGGAGVGAAGSALALKKYLAV